MIRVIFILIIFVLLLLLLLIFLDRPAKDPLCSYSHTEVKNVTRVTEKTSRFQWGVSTLNFIIIFCSSVLRSPFVSTFVLPRSWFFRVFFYSTLQKKNLIILFHSPKVKSMCFLMNYYFPIALQKRFLFKMLQVGWMS